MTEGERLGAALEAAVRQEVHAAQTAALELRQKADLEACRLKWVEHGSASRGAVRAIKRILRRIL